MSTREIPRIYDIAVDGYRDVTQEDVNRLVECEQGFGALLRALRWLLSEGSVLERVKELEAASRLGSGER